MAGTVPLRPFAIATIVPPTVPEICVAANGVHYANVASFTADFIAHLEEKPEFLEDEAGLLPKGVALNINYPPIPPEEIQGVSSNVQGRLLVLGGTPLDVSFVCFACAFIPVGASSPGGIGGAGFDPTPDVEGSDATSFVDGFITVVPIEADYTANEDLLDGFEDVIEKFNDDDDDDDDDEDDDD